MPKPIRTTTEKDEQVQWSRALVKGFAWLSVLLLALEALFLEMLHIWRLAEMLNVWLILKWFSLVLFVCILLIGSLFWIDELNKRKIRARTKGFIRLNLLGVPRKKSMRAASLPASVVMYRFSPFRIMLPFGIWLWRRQNYKARRVFYGTDRCPTYKSGRRSYAGERHPEGRLSFGVCVVTLPSTHQIGSLESPSIIKLEFAFNPAKHVTLVDVREQQWREFFTGVSDEVKASTRQEAFVFIHGYNVSFDEAARRTAQIAEDLNFDGAAIFYSWPSRGRVRAYPVDETNVGWTVNHLKVFLTELAETVGASTIHLIAHSMGNRALAAALQSWQYQEKATRPSFRQVVLTAPDIDADTFKEIAAAIPPTTERITLYSSHLDKALILSKRFHGYQRAGECIVVINGVDTVDASAVDTSFFGHSYAAENRTVLQDIYWLLRNHPPESRFGITRVEHPDGSYYVFRP